ncbi:DNA-directed RNA polymerase subunit beta [Nocardia abscessus]|uniref:DNA-directed RNA polymerase subunit beta n=1 Tax=Nocardia abscessus TaxID=120957 RepID=UPI0024551D3A|nr:DNA-directed RNA polymerase subunit beta [Nocardia abscessus]
MPTFVVPGTGRISMRAGRIGAITLPAQLGAAVRQYLHARAARPGPVVSHPRSKRWTFLVVPNVPLDDIRLFAELFRLNASIAPFGAEIALPSPADQRTATRIWVHAPRDSYRPSGLSVVESIRACATPSQR